MIKINILKFIINGIKSKNINNEFFQKFNSLKYYIRNDNFNNPVITLNYIDQLLYDSISKNKFNNQISFRIYREISDLNLYFEKSNKLFEYIFNRTNFLDELSIKDLTDFINKLNMNKLSVDSLNYWLIMDKLEDIIITKIDKIIDDNYKVELNQDKILVDFLIYINRLIFENYNYITFKNLKSKNLEFLKYLFNKKLIDRTELNNFLDFYK